LQGEALNLSASKRLL